ncbi:MAG: hypothetical protein QM689_10630 [Oscillospiraceae bacterium]
MNYVCFIGNAEDTGFRIRLERLFRKHFPVDVIDDESIVMDASGENTGIDTAFTIITGAALSGGNSGSKRGAVRSVVKIDNSVLVFGENATTLPQGITGRNLTGILTQSNHRLTESLKNANIPVLTCGMSQKDTVTYSSFTGDKLVVSLQRRLKTPHGVTVEPFEMPIALDSREDIIPALVFFAICAEYGTIDKNLLG